MTCSYIVQKKPVCPKRSALGNGYHYRCSRIALCKERKSAIVRPLKKNKRTEKKTEEANRPLIIGELSIRIDAIQEESQSLKPEIISSSLGIGCR